MQRGGVARGVGRPLRSFGSSIDAPPQGSWNADGAFRWGSAGDSDLLIKCVPPETLERFGGARKYADAVNTSLTTLGELLREPESIRDLLLGKQ